MQGLGVTVSVTKFLQSPMILEMYLELPSSMAECRSDMEKRAEWPARGRAAVSPFPGDILPSRTVLLRMVDNHSTTAHQPNIMLSVC